MAITRTRQNGHACIAPRPCLSRHTQHLAQGAVHVSRPAQRAVMSRIAIDSANASGIGIPPAITDMSSQSQPAPAAAARPRPTIPTSATPLQKEQFKNQIISPNRANAAVALSALFRSEPAPAEVANASAIVAQQVCLHLGDRASPRASFCLNWIRCLIRRILWPANATCACFFVFGYPNRKVMGCAHLRG
jgi:hypothetical protein